jgi:hypothetical protein
MLVRTCSSNRSLARSRVCVGGGLRGESWCVYYSAMILPMLLLLLAPWHADVIAFKAALEEEMARRLQGAYRIHRAREFMKVMRDAREREREEWAACKIQVLLRVL